MEAAVVVKVVRLFLSFRAVVFGAAWGLCCSGVWFCARLVTVVQWGFEFAAGARTWGSVVLPGELSLSGGSVAIYLKWQPQEARGSVFGRCLV